jgi:ferredoxin--NADP+ reductase
VTSAAELGAAQAGPLAGDWPLAGVLAGRGVNPVSYAEWLRIETAETDLAQALGRGERVKLHNREAIWAACRPPRDT